MREVPDWIGHIPCSQDLRSMDAVCRYCREAYAELEDTRLKEIRIPAAGTYPMLWRYWFNHRDDVDTGQEIVDWLVDGLYKYYGYMIPICGGQSRLANPAPCPPRDMLVVLIDLPAHPPLDDDRLMNIFEQPRRAEEEDGMVRHEKRVNYEFQLPGRQLVPLGKRDIEEMALEYMFHLSGRRLGWLHEIKEADRFFRPHF